MRARNIKPGFFKNELLGSADPLIGILFQGLWCCADREGRLSDRPLRLCAEIFPYRRSVTEKKVETMLQWLAEWNFICRYKVGSESFIQVVEFTKHQNPHSKERPSEIPSLSSVSPSASNPPSTVQEQGEDGKRQCVAHLIPDSLIPDSGFLIPDSPESGVPPPFMKPATDRTPTPEADMAIPLMKAGVKVTSMHPLLVGWVKDGFTVQQAMSAVAVARSHLGDEQGIPAKYLDTVIRNPPKPGPKVNGNHAPARPRELTPGEIIEQAIRDGRTDDEIASMPELDLIPNLRQDIIDKRQEIRSHVEH